MWEKRELLAEGKTKRIWRVKDSTSIVRIENKDDITAGDGAKHDVIEGKGALDNRLNANIFRILNSYGNLPTHFYKEVSDTDFLALACEMIPIEVVVRRYATGSYLKRNPGVKKGHRFDDLVVELFLKDDVRHDPIIIIIIINGFGWNLYDSKKVQMAESWMGKVEPVCSGDDLYFMDYFAKEVFIILEVLWSNMGYKLWDFKVEFGYHNGQVVLADVITSTEWRVTDLDGQQMDKQLYREDESLILVKERFEMVTDLSEKFWESWFKIRDKI